MVVGHGDAVQGQVLGLTQHAGEQDGTVHGRAVTSCTPAFTWTWRLSVLNAPEPTLYRRVSEPVSMVSQPSTVLDVNGEA